MAPQIENHSLTALDLSKHVAALADLDITEVGNFVVVVKTMGGQMLIVSADQHQRCLAGMLGTAYLRITDDAEPDFWKPPADSSVATFTGPDGSVTAIIPDDEK